MVSGAIVPGIMHPPREGAGYTEKGRENTRPALLPPGKYPGKGFVSVPGCNWLFLAPREGSTSVRTNRNPKPALPPYPAPCRVCFGFLSCPFEPPPRHPRRGGVPAPGRFPGAGVPGVSGGKSPRFVPGSPSCTFSGTRFGGATTRPGCFCAVRFRYMPTTGGVHVVLHFCGCWIVPRNPSRLPSRRVPVLVLSCRGDIGTPAPFRGFGFRGKAPRPYLHHRRNPSPVRGFGILSGILSHFPAPAPCPGCRCPFRGGAGGFYRVPLSEYPGTMWPAVFRWWIAYRHPVPVFLPVLPGVGLIPLFSRFGIRYRYRCYSVPVFATSSGVPFRDGVPGVVGVRGEGPHRAPPGTTRGAPPYYTRVAPPFAWG